MAHGGPSYKAELVARFPQQHKMMILGTRLGSAPNQVKHESLLEGPSRPLSLGLRRQRTDKGGTHLARERNLPGEGDTSDRPAALGEEHVERGNPLTGRLGYVATQWKCDRHCHVLDQVDTSNGLRSGLGVVSPKRCRVSAV
jgi:hypothetical protein